MNMRAKLVTAMVSFATSGHGFNLGPPRNYQTVVGVPRSISARRTLEDILICRCDTRSHFASELADWRADYVGSVVRGACSAARSAAAAPRPRHAHTAKCALTSLVMPPVQCVILGAGYDIDVGAISAAVNIPRACAAGPDPVASSSPPVAARHHAADTTGRIRLRQHPGRCPPIPMTLPARPEPDWHDARTVIRPAVLPL